MSLLEQTVQKTFALIIHNIDSWIPRSNLNDNNINTDDSYSQVLSKHSLDITSGLVAFCRNGIILDSDSCTVYFLSGCCGLCGATSEFASECIV